MRFEECVAVILDFEGGYVNDPRDPSGETKFGISKRAYPELTIKNLTVADARYIYRKNYWDAISGDDLPDYIRLLMFDCAVNQGVSRAVIYAQRSAGANDDGIMGPQTVSALFRMEPSILVRELSLQRHNSYTNSQGWKHYGAGWSRRLLDIVLITLGYLDMID